MGKGDKKTKRGKITIGSYGVRRQKNKKKNQAVTAKTASESTTAEKASTPKKTTAKTTEPKAKKAPAKKAASKKEEA